MWCGVNFHATSPGGSLATFIDTSSKVHLYLHLINLSLITQNILCILDKRISYIYASTSFWNIITATMTTPPISSTFVSMDDFLNEPTADDSKSKTNTAGLPSPARSDGASTPASSFSPPVQPETINWVGLLMGPFFLPYVRRHPIWSIFISRAEADKRPQNMQPKKAPHHQHSAISHKSAA